MVDVLSSAITSRNGRALATQHPARLSRRIGSVGLLSLILTCVVLVGCEKAAESPPEVRPVRVVKAERHMLADAGSLTGEIRAQEEVALSFRIGGRMIARAANVGDQIGIGQLLARLDPQPEDNAAKSAQADVAAASAAVTEARNTEQRQHQLLEKSITTRAAYDAALRQLQTAQAQIDSAEARLKTANDRRGYTDLYADTAGDITATGAEPGEVVNAGQMIVKLARGRGRDAVFAVPDQIIRAAPKDPSVEIVLVDDPTIRTSGRVREVSPQADPITRTHTVKVSLQDTPPDMHLGATVIGRLMLAAKPAIELPGTVLTAFQGKPAVWIFDQKSETVNLRPVGVLRYGAGTVIVSDGLEDNELVVTAGVHTLRPGQKVRLLETGT
jgi:membrane fusion protein, multidrug efflux system